MSSKNPNICHSSLRFVSSTASMLNLIKSNQESSLYNSDLLQNGEPPNTSHSSPKNPPMNPPIQAPPPPSCNCQRFPALMSDDNLVHSLLLTHREHLHRPFGVQDLPSHCQVKDVYPALCECKLEAHERARFFFGKADDDEEHDMRSLLKHCPCQYSFYHFVLNASKKFTEGGDRIFYYDSKEIKPSVQTNEMWSDGPYYVSNFLY